MIRRRCVKTSGETPTVHTIGGAAAAKVRPVTGVVLPTATNTPAGGSRGRLGLWALRVLVDPYIRLDIYGPHQERYVTNFLHDFSIPSQHHIYSLLQAASLHTHQLPEWSGGRFHINNKLFLICLPGMAWFGYYFSALGGGLVQQVARRGEENLLFYLLFLVFG